MNNLVPIVAIIALLVFAWMRNKQARRNDKRRERLWEMQERLIETLQAQNNEEKDNTATT